MNGWRRFLFPVVLAVAGTLLIAIYIFNRERPSPPQSAPNTPIPTLTPEPIVPTKTPEHDPSATPAATPAQPQETAASTPTHIPSATPNKTLEPLFPLPDRFGVGAATGSRDVPAAVAAGLPFSLYLTWGLQADPLGGPEIVFWQMVRMQNGEVNQSWDNIGQVIEKQPGAIWIMGNEPDVIWQDNVTAERYAELYHDVYTFIKERDPEAQIAIAGVAQPTPLRLAYLDQILAAYQSKFDEPMPVDIWTIHAFILREEAGSWGVDIPPGMDGADGRLVEIADHNDIELFKQSIIDFRAWMAERGYADRPLAVTEFGILMPFDYGFPPDVVIDFMTETLDFLTTATGDTGYGPDGGRLVQWWFWYSLSDREDYYPTGNLFDPATGEPTVLGQAYADYVNARLGNE